LDGSWEGWVKSNPIAINQANQICKLLMGNQPWNGPSDLSANIYAMYDKDYLYVGAEVTDDVVETRWNFPIMSYPWDTDCMEVVLDTRAGSDQGSDTPTTGLFRQLSMASIAPQILVPPCGKAAAPAGRCFPNRIWFLARKLISIARTKATTSFVVIL
jgi:hypothetical protein